MKIALYGTESDNGKLMKLLAVLPDYSYRNIETVVFSEYNSFITGLGESSPQCIVITMDGADGMEGVIAARDMFKNIPVIWFSDDNGFGVQSYRLGCAYFHEKPVSPEILSAAIAKCM